MPLNPHRRSMFLKELEQLNKDEMKLLLQVLKQHHKRRAKKKPKKK